MPVAPLPAASLFVPHGAPTFALTPGAAGTALGRLGRQLARPRAIVVVSPHWDTAAPAIGGALGSAAICTKQELLLVIIGGIFVMEAMSVILQVGSFKLRKKRIFRMSPIHHHFELLGWHESQVIVRFWILSIMLALFGLAILKIA